MILFKIYFDFTTYFQYFQRLKLESLDFDELIHITEINMKKESTYDVVSKYKAVLSNK